MVEYHREADWSLDDLRSSGEMRVLSTESASAKHTAFAQWALLLVCRDSLNLMFWHWAAKCCANLIRAWSSLYSEILTAQHRLSVQKVYFRRQPSVELQDLVCIGDFSSSRLKTWWKSYKLLTADTWGGGEKKTTWEALEIVNVHQFFLKSLFRSDFSGKISGVLGTVKDRITRIVMGNQYSIHLNMQIGNKCKLSRWSLKWVSHCFLFCLSHCSSWYFRN